MYVDSNVVCRCESATWHKPPRTFGSANEGYAPDINCQFI